MKNTKFVVKVNRGGTLKPEYVQRIDRTPIQMTSDRKLALLMGRLTAEDAVKSIETPGAARSWCPFRSAPSRAVAPNERNARNPLGYGHF